MSSRPSNDREPAEQTSAVRWFLRGAASLFSVPSLILSTSFVGFAALAMESGITQAQAVFMTLVVWAVPA